MIKLVIFDLDNTLYDYDICNQKAERELFNELSALFDINEEKCNQLLNDAKRNVKALLGGVAASHNRLLYCQNICEQLNVNPLLYARRLYDAYWDTFLSNMRLYDYVIPTITNIKDIGIKIAILTDLTAAIQYRKLEKTGLSRYVDYLVTSEEAGAEKPAKVMFDCILNKAGCSAGECIMVGDDMKKDVEGALNVGIQSILYNSNIDVWEEVKRINESNNSCSLL